MYLPEDINILLSVINTRLRDGFSSLDELCEQEDISRDSLEIKLAAAGYYYDEKLNAFKEN